MMNCGRPVSQILQCPVPLWCRFSLKLKIHRREGESWKLGESCMFYKRKPIDQNLLFTGVGKTPKIKTFFFYVHLREIGGSD